MNLTLRTKVKGHYLQLMKRFDLDLFQALKPIGARMEVVRFTGSQTGDIVEIKFISPIKASWISKITDHGSDDKMAYFVDEGAVLPPPLKSWKHRHIIEKLDDNNSYIVDDITYSSGYWILDVLLYPFMFLGFYPRKFSYRKYFGT
jgi:ligand-binding SRPBCC domain-containing protein